jgi:hypothetical protein
MSGFAIVRHPHRATPMIGEQPFNHYTAFRWRPADYVRRVAHGFSLNADAVMLDFEDAGDAPVEAADARYLGLAEFAVVSAQVSHFRGGMSFAEA